uniref:Uncharacterized protein n=1 Tax=Lutzomyia longipalpis TaxID=7200 RepID=A0A1B0C9R7_LUTLO
MRRANTYHTIFSGRTTRGHPWILPVFPLEVAHCRVYCGYRRTQFSMIHSLPRRRKCGMCCIWRSCSGIICTQFSLVRRPTTMSQHQFPVR